MKKYLLISFIVCMFSILNVSALDKCTTDEMNRLKELASNVEFTYKNEILDVESESGEGTEKINIYNISILNDNIDLKYKYRIGGDNDQFGIDKETFSNLEFYGGDKLVISIYAYTTNMCTGKILKTKTVKLPHYNYFFLDNNETCKEYPEFKYCEEFMDTSDLTDEEFQEELEKYKEDLKEKDNNNKEENFNYLYILYILIPIILITGVIIVVIRYKKKDRDL